MRFRFRLGPFTFGRSGTRLSLWSGGTGVSIPLSKKKGGTFGKVKVGPVSGYFGGSSNKSAATQRSQAKTSKKRQVIGSGEAGAIKEIQAKGKPECPECGSPMKLITPRPGQRWKKFWGCTMYSSKGCRGSRKA